MGYRRGDIIWARVQYPQEKWWPGLVLGIKGQWVSVSLLDANKRNGSRYFLKTEVCSFQENFGSLVKTLLRNSSSSAGHRLLDFALKLIARRVFSSLKCSCHLWPIRKRKDGEVVSSSRRKRKDLFFQCDMVLGFVLDVAVSPFIGVTDLVYAVTMAAKINAFRRYVVGACSVAQKSDTSEFEFESLNEDQPNCRAWIKAEQTKPQTSREMLVILHCLALDTNCLSGECMNTVKQNVLMFRNLTYQPILNPKFKKCSDSSTSVPRYIKSQPSVLNGNNCRDVFAPPKAYAGSSIKFLGLKRQFDPPVDSGFSSKLCKTKPLLSINGAYVYLEKGKIAQNVCVFDAWISKPAFLEAQKFCKTMPVAFSNGTDAYLHINRTRCEANTFDAFSSGYKSKLDIVMIDNASAGTRKYLPSVDIADQIPKEACSSDLVETNEQVSNNAAFRDRSIDDTKLHPLVTSNVSIRPKEKQQSTLGTLSDCHYLHMKFPKDFKVPSKEYLIRKFSRFGEVDSFRTKIFPRLGSAQVVFFHHLDAMTAYQYAKRKKVLSNEAKILFWLDPREKKSRASKFKAPLPNLKSCLKRSDRKQGQEDKKQKKKVRFLMET